MNQERHTHPIEKWPKYLKRPFIKDNIQMVNMNMKICSTSLITSEPLRCISKPQRDTLTLPSEWLKLKGMTLLRINKDVENQNSHSLLESSAGSATLENPVGIIYQTQTSCTHDLAIPPLGRYPTEICDPMYQKTYARMDTAILFIIAIDWNQIKYPLTEERIHKLWYINTMENYNTMKKN